MWGSFWIDGVVGILVVLYIWQAWERSGLENLSETISWVVGWQAMHEWQGKLMRMLVVSFGVGKEWGAFGAQLLLFLIGQQAVYWGLKAFMEKAVRQQHLARHWHTLFTLLPTAVSGIMLMSLIVFVLIRLPIDFPLQAEIQTSLFSKWLSGRLPPAG